MRLVYWRGAQYDADRLPAHIDASECVPLDQWFAENRRVGGASVQEAPAPKKQKVRRARVADAD